MRENNDKIIEAIKNSIDFVENAVCTALVKRLCDEFKSSQRITEEYLYDYDKSKYVCRDGSPLHSYHEDILKAKHLLDLIKKDCIVVSPDIGQKLHESYYADAEKWQIAKIIIDSIVDINLENLELEDKRLFHIWAGIE